MAVNVLITLDSFILFTLTEPQILLRITTCLFMHILKHNFKMTLRECDGLDCYSFGSSENVTKDF